MAFRLLGAVLVTAVLCAPAAAAEKRQPSREMLDFLADFETDGGKAVDPLQFAPPEGKKKSAKQTVKKKRQQGRSALVRSKGEKP